MTESGDISHYTVEFQDVIVENIAVENLDIIQQEVHTHKRDDEKDHDKEKPIVKEEELEEAKGEKGDADPLGGERAKFDKDHDGVPDGADKDKDDPEIKEQVTRDEVRADFKRIFPKETPEQIEARVDDYMEPPISKPKRRGDPNAPMPLADIPGHVFRGLEEKARLQEVLKKLAKAKNITLKSSGKKIK